MPAVLDKKKNHSQSIDEEKNKLAIKLLSMEDETLFHTLKMIYEDLMNTTNRVKRTTKAKYNSEVDAAVKRVRNGKSVSNDTVMNEMDKW